VPRRCGKSSPRAGLLCGGSQNARRHTIVFGGPHGSKGTDAPQEGDFRLEVMGHKLAAMVMPQGQALSGLGREGAEGLFLSLSYRLQGLAASTAG
jgi:hypothetical protein